VEPERVTVAFPEVAVMVPETVKAWVPTERETVVAAKPLAANIKMNRKGKISFLLILWYNTDIYVSIFKTVTVIRCLLI
jgi:hypothetical protein